MRKVSSFTITEIAVVMVLSGITLSTGFLVYLNFTKIFNRTIFQHHYNNEILLFHGTFLDDFEKAKKVYYHSGFYRFDNPDDSQVKYEVDETMIIRKLENNQDTFRVALDNINYKVLKVENKNLIQELSFDIITREKYVFPVYLTKIYSNQILFNLDKNKKK